MKPTLSQSCSTIAGGQVSVDRGNLVPQTDPSEPISPTLLLIATRDIAVGEELVGLCNKMANEEDKGEGAKLSTVNKYKMSMYIEIYMQIISPHGCRNYQDIDVVEI